MKEGRNEGDSYKVVVPKLWKALKAGRSIKKRPRNLDGILVNSLIGFSR